MIYPPAPNPEFFADYATWKDAVLEWERLVFETFLELAAGQTCCGEDDESNVISS